MDPNSVILDISSDEDGGLHEPSHNNLDSISQPLDPVANRIEEPNDAVGAAGNQIYRTSDRVKPAFRDDLDDDCLILDGDPDNPVAAVNDTANGSDELLVVGEKGQLACRDYPHSRHLCANFPFSSTPHENYCDMCHCYVCDLRAPCIYWSTDGHCHSTDKEEIWQLQRNHFKQSKLPPIPVLKLPDTIPKMLPLSNLVPVHTPSELHNSGYISTHSISRPTPVHACPSTMSFGMRDIIDQQQELIQGRNRFPQHGSRSHLMPSMNDSIRRGRGRGVGTLGPRFIPPHMNFKTVGSVGSALTMKQSGYGSSNNNNLVYESQLPMNQFPLGLSNDDSHMRLQDLHAGIGSDIGTFQSSSQTNAGYTFLDFLPDMISQPQDYSQPNPQSNQNQNLYLHENFSPNAANTSVPDFNFGWINRAGQSIQHPMAEGSQLQSAQLTSDPPPVTEFNPQNPTSTNLGSSDFHLENWCYSMDCQSIPLIAEGFVPSELNFVSPQPAYVDPAMPIYDPEISWNAPAQV